MITFISCSIRPDMAAALNENIKKTIGIPYEFIAFDNREVGNGICKVYNDCAQKAQFDYLCFLHEDVKFKTKEWGASVVEKLQEVDCGAIGFAGSALKLDLPSGWGCIREASRSNVKQHNADKSVTHDLYNPNNERFAQVVTLDGLCIFVRKDVWQKCLFDDVTFASFHGYDLDFAMSVSEYYKNYVCYTLEIEHLSPGSYNKDWMATTKKLHDKWKCKLPMSTSEWRVYAKSNDITSIEYIVIEQTLQNLKEIADPYEIGLSFFKRNWSSSYYAWKMLAKLTRLKFKEFKN